MNGLSPHQRIAVASRSRDLLVNAGAGSGKTRVLVEAVIASIIEDRIDIEDILVVTFTEKAAGELRERIDAALSSARRPDIRTRLPGASISTIHAFCARLLRDHFVRAEVDPRFRVIPEEDSSLLLQSAMTRVFHLGYSGGFDSGDGGHAGLDTEVFEELVTMCRFDSSGERLRSVIRSLLDYARSSEEPDRFLQEHLDRLGRPPRCWQDVPWREAYLACVTQAWRTALGMVEHLVAGIEAASADPSEFRRFLDVLGGLGEAWLADPEGQQKGIAFLQRAGFIGDRQYLKLPTMPHLSDEYSGLKDFRARVAQALRNPWLRRIPLDWASCAADDAAAGRLLCGLTTLTRLVWAEYEREKERAGGCDFSDLEIRALRLVRRLEEDGAPVRFRRAFIDEFQDINGLQHRILSGVCGTEGVFRVGDVKQSIYQFRLADPSIFRDIGKGRAIVIDPEHSPDDSTPWTIPLPQNYRSGHAVLRVTNAVAGGLFLESEIGSPYEEQRLMPGRASDAGAPVEMWIVPSPSGGDEDCDPDEWEGRAIADRIRDWIDSNETILDPHTQERRPMRYGDIAILLRARRRGPGIQRSLAESEIPAHLALGESFFESREVQDLALLLQTIDNVLDDVTLAGSLRSPAFGWTDADLLVLRMAYPLATHLAYSLALLADEAPHPGAPFAADVLPPEAGARAVLCGPPGDVLRAEIGVELGARAVATMDRIRAWRQLQGTVDLDEFLTRVLSDSGLETAHASQPDGLRRRANLRKAVGFARRFARETGYDLHRFLRWFRNLEEDGMPISEAQVASESMDVVRILTIHQAKGLEFPVVILARLNSHLMIGDAVSEIQPGREFLGIRLLDPTKYVTRDPLPLEILREQRKQDQIAEEKRVLYVAMTRARERLVLCSTEDTKSEPSEEQLALFARARRRGDGVGDALIRHLLAAKATYRAWIAYTLGSAMEGRDELPLRIVRVEPGSHSAPIPVDKRAASLEARVRTLAPVELPEEETSADRGVAEVVAGVLRVPPLPSAGHLRAARGKIWATEFKGTDDDIRRMRAFPDESASADMVLLIERAAEEGTLLHAILERLDLRGLDPGNLDKRLLDAARCLGGVEEASLDLLRTALMSLITTDIGSMIVTGAPLEREVAFSMRLGIMDVARLMPALADEMESSPVWRHWIERDERGLVRIRPDRNQLAATPWILVQGRIDAVVRTSSGWAVLDWKSDRVRGANDIARRVPLYEGQMTIYRKAVERLFGTPVTTGLFFLRPGILRWLEGRPD